MFRWSSILTDQNFAIHGGDLIRVVVGHLGMNGGIHDKFKSFFLEEDNLSDLEVIKKVTVYVIQTYSRMRGKDIVFKIMACGKFQPKLNIRQKRAAVVNQDTYRKSSKKQDKSEDKSDDKLKVSESEASNHQTVDKLLGQNERNVLDSDSDSEESGAS